MTSLTLSTPRLLLRPWKETDREAFAAMNADVEVMRDLGGPIGRAASDAKLDRYAAVFSRCGFGRWVLEGGEGAFLGYAGLMPSPVGHPLGPHVEVGRRLVRRAWSLGYASEAAAAALEDAFRRVGLDEVLAYTAADNPRSQAVMRRLGLRREPLRDFTADYPGFPAWTGLVWVACPS